MKDKAQWLILAGFLLVALYMLTLPWTSEWWDVR